MEEERKVPILSHHDDDSVAGEHEREHGDEIGEEEASSSGDVKEEAIVYQIAEKLSAQIIAEALKSALESQSRSNGSLANQLVGAGMPEEEEEFDISELGADDELSGGSLSGQGEESATLTGDAGSGARTRDSSDEMLDGRGRRRRKRRSGNSRRSSTIYSSSCSPARFDGADILEDLSEMSCYADRIDSILDHHQPNYYNPISGQRSSVSPARSNLAPQGEPVLEDEEAAEVD